jgi:polysaccharide biosynthesis protein PslH
VRIISSPLKLQQQPRFNHYEDFIYLSLCPKFDPGAALSVCPALSHAWAPGNTVTIWSSSNEKRDLEDIQQYCHSVYAFELKKVRSYWNCLAAIPTKDPLQSVYCWAPEANRQIDQLIAQSDFDIIHIEHMRGARYGLALLNGKDRAHSVPVVWDSVDSISHLFRQASSKSQALFSRLMTSFELGRTETYENKLLNSFDHVLVTSSTDRDAFLRMERNGSKENDITVVNNGVDLIYFCPDPTIQRERDSVVVSGKLSYHANINMVLFLVNQIMPHVWRQKPETKLVIVGKDPPREILALGEKAEITVTGTVKDMRPYLQQAAIAVSPITYGAGIQNKVLEAMACGTPVISTSQAVSALAVVPGSDVLVEDDPGAFANAIVQLLDDVRQQDSLSSAGRRFVEKHHDWNVISSQLEVIYNHVIERKREL